MWRKVSSRLHAASRPGSSSSYAAASEVEAVLHERLRARAGPAAPGCRARAHPPPHERARPRRRRRRGGRCSSGRRGRLVAAGARHQHDGRLPAPADEASATPSVNAVQRDVTPAGVVGADRHHHDVVRRGVEAGDLPGEVRGDGAADGDRGRVGRDRASLRGPARARWLSPSARARPATPWPWPPAPRRTRRCWRWPTPSSPHEAAVLAANAEDVAAPRRRHAANIIDRLRLTPSGSPAWPRGPARRRRAARPGRRGGPRQHAGQRPRAAPGAGAVRCRRDDLRGPPQRHRRRRRHLPEVRQRGAAARQLERPVQQRRDRRGPARRSRPQPACRGRRPAGARRQPRERQGADAGPRPGRRAHPARGSRADPQRGRGVDRAGHRDRRRQLPRVRRRGGRPRQGARDRAELQDPPHQRLQRRRVAAGARGRRRRVPAAVVEALQGPA
jgi:hypothetical protein